MNVIKRNGTEEKVKFDKISARIEKQCYGLNSDFVEPYKVATKVIQGVKDGITTRELDELASRNAGALISTHPDYSKLAARISVTALHKETSKSFGATIEKLHKYIDPKTNLNASLIDDEVYKIIKKNTAKINESIDYNRDFNFDYVGFKTLERSYLLKVNGNIVERPQHMWMRVAIGIHKDDIDAAIQTYDLMSQGFFTHATPTLFNAGTPMPQMSSCFLLGVDDDLKGIFEAVSECAMISKSAGGIGLWAHDIRAKGSYIKSTNGYSNGLVPMLKVFNQTARYVDQGGGRRMGSFAVYLEPWHADIYDFLDLKKNHGMEDVRARDLFYAMWTPDLFMQRVEENGDWHLFDPAESPNLSDVYGDKFEALYNKYVKQGKFVKVVKARDLFYKIMESQIETGVPYMLYKDAANKKSNQKNLGTIKSSNLCTEIIQYTDPHKEIAVCNLASIALPKFLKQTNRAKNVLNKVWEYDYERLHEVTKIIVKNLNKVIDHNFYPVEAARTSNLKHRPIALGVQGLADVYAKMHIAFDSDEAKQINKNIFETIYHAAVESSADAAKIEGAYETFKGSDMSKGVFQFDLWDQADKTKDGWEYSPIKLSEELSYDWDSLKETVKSTGVRNSLLVGPMPTASTSQILGNNECFEPFTANIYKRNLISGEFIVMNKHLIERLVALGMWSDEVKQILIAAKGSVQNIEGIPEDVKEVFKTVWEIKQSHILDMAADRGAFIDQSQSMNIFMTGANFKKLSSAHMYAWKKGLKTGMYYLRTQAATDASQFTIDKKYRDAQKVVKEPTVVLSEAYRAPMPKEESIEEEVVQLVENSEVQPPQAITDNEFEQKVYGIDELPPKPTDSQFDCIGCGS
jgi:ribonucleoside-diphosphate reductase alpha chain